ncbi:unnamed protein product [Effrenium voratum]|uniref:GB1/RHD3-type G domain-containing protein n=1 Tax=Effrenium voratum TaxID=2562239 RepID=A0AA36MPD9_9DINO|nr:unnamed protein product [Effrenium voratum]CAJ1447391.1 unnamed protein product [Effrenium voratum]
MVEWGILAQEATHLARNYFRSNMQAMAKPHGIQLGRPPDLVHPALGLKPPVYKPDLDRKSFKATPVASLVLSTAVGVLSRCKARQRRACGRKAAEVAVLSDSPSKTVKPRALQLVKIDLKNNKVLLNESDLSTLEEELQRSGVEKIAVVAVMGAFRTGKSFLLDLMLRYLRAKHPPTGRAPENKEDCEMPKWVEERGVPDWAVTCGASLQEGRQGGRQDREGFVWRPGMEKCTEGIWVWSEVFVCKAGNEDVAVMLMDTQGAWDARMSKEQSATVFGLTTLLASRLVYNVSKQIQQDKIDNLLYFTDFAQAALRALQREPTDAKEPFQTLEFLVRDWPHYQENCSIMDGKKMMKTHLDQYFSSERSEDTRSVEALSGMFRNIDVWCLPHPSLKIERESWDGDLAVIEKSFWRFIDGYLEKIFDPAELRAKAILGSAVTSSTFGTLMREFTAAFSEAAPQAKTFSEAMEASSSLLARDLAMRKAKAILEEKARSSPSAVSEEEFEQIAATATEAADEEFTNKALFGSSEGIMLRKDMLLKDLQEEIARARDENERKLEESLTGLTNFSIVGLAAFAVDRLSDLTCDWWSSFCREASTDLSYVEVGVFGWVAFSLYQISQKQGQLNAAAAGLELAKTVMRQLDRGFKAIQKERSDTVEVEVEVKGGKEKL